MVDKKITNNQEKEKQNRDNEDAHLELSSEGKFIRGEYVLEQLGITVKTLYSLAESGEFLLGRIAGRDVILADEFYRYLDRVHFGKRENPEDRPAIDSKGRIKKNLTPIKEPHTSVPKLMHIKHFAKDLGVEQRTFTRHCDTGTFRHYRIGSLYKMSQEDYDKSLELAARTNLKSNRKRTRVGRPNEIVKKMAKKSHGKTK